MSSITKFFKHQFVNPSIMTIRTKNIWCIVGCGVTTVLTLSYLFNENEKHNSRTFLKGFNKIVTEKS